MNVILNKQTVDFKRTYKLTNDKETMAMLLNPEFSCAIPDEDVEEATKYYFDELSKRHIAPLQVNINTMHCFGGLETLAIYNMLCQQKHLVEFDVLFYDLTDEEEKHEAKELFKLGK